MGNWWLPRWWLYRPIMRLAHRFDWHWAPISGPYEDGARERWCHWCGMRDKVIDTRGPLTVEARHD